MARSRTPSGGSESSFGQIVSAVASIAKTRLEIFGIELAEEKERVLSTLLLSLVALMVGMLALVSLTALIVILFWDTYRWQPLAILTAVYLLIAVYCLLRAKNAVDNAPQPFETTRAEFENDRVLFEKVQAHRDED